MHGQTLQSVIANVMILLWITILVRSTNGGECKLENQNENARLLVSVSLYWQVSYMTIGGLVQFTERIAPSDSAIE